MNNLSRPIDLRASLRKKKIITVEVEEEAARGRAEGGEVGGLGEGAGEGRGGAPSEQKTTLRH